MDWLPSTRPPTRHQTHNPGTCSDWESKQGPFALQDNAQPTEPHQPGKRAFFIVCLRNHKISKKINPQNRKKYLPNIIKGSVSKIKIYKPTNYNRKHYPILKKWIGDLNRDSTEEEIKWLIIIQGAQSPE